MKSERNILLVAGEPSGDLQASLLLRQIAELAPDVHFWGFGGSRLRNMGMETICDVSELAVMGLFDVITQLPRFRRIMKMLLSEVAKRKPRCAILVDYPGFNLSLAAKLKNMGLMVGYYISPQLWAWGEKRVEKIRRYIDMVVCILPFEKEFYASHGIHVEYVGHPFVDIVSPEMSEYDFRRRIGIDGDFIVFMPGSRKKEIARILPPLIKSFRLLKSRHRDLCAVIPAVEGFENLIRQMIVPYKDIQVITGLTYSAMAYAKAGIVASGSATVEALISRLPTVVVYKTDSLSWAIGKRIMKTKHIALANLIAGEMIFPEYIQHLRPGVLAHEIEKIMFDEDIRCYMKTKSAEAARKLGDGNAPEKAAKIFLKLFCG